MDITELITPDSVNAHLRVNSKKHALQELGRIAAAQTGLDAREVCAKLHQRERLGTTGVGHGIAIPHGKFAGLDRLYGLFARLARPVDFESVDDRPVDLVFVLLAPEGSGANHLKALSRISRQLRDPAYCDKLRGADTRDALYALLTQAPATHAA